MIRALLITVSVMCCSTPTAAKTWAVQFPYGNGELSPVFHARSPNEALAKAMKFCKERELCRNQFPSGEIETITATGVVGYTNIFVTTVCQQENGEHAYITAPSVYDGEAGREDGKNKGEEALRGGGLSTENCSIHAVYGVKSRDLLKNNLAGGFSGQKVQTLNAQIRSYKVQRRNATRTATEILD